MFKKDFLRIQSRILIKVITCPSFLLVNGLNWSNAIFICGPNIRGIFCQGWKLLNSFSLMCVDIVFFFQTWKFSLNERPFAKWFQFYVFGLLADFFTRYALHGSTQLSLHQFKISYHPPFFLNYVIFYIFVAPGIIPLSDVFRLPFHSQ